MYHDLKGTAKKPKEREKLGTIQPYRFKHIDSMGLTYHILAGGEESITETKHDRIMIVIDGLADITSNHLNGRYDPVLREGTVYEIPAGTKLKIHGQLKYYLVSHQG